MVSGRLEPGIGMTTGACASSQASATCCGRGVQLLGHLGERGVARAQVGRALDAAERAPREEGDAELGAQVELGLAGAEARGVLVLHRRQPATQHLLGAADLVGVGVGDAGEPDLPASIRSRSAPTDSSNGTSGSGRWYW